MIDEKRYFPRFFHAWPVRFEFLDPGRFGGCMSCDLSEGGVRIRCSEFIALRTKTAVQIHLSNDSLVECVGYVVWVEKNRFGDSYQAGLVFEKSGTLFGAQRRIRDILSMDAGGSVSKQHFN